MKCPNCGHDMQDGHLICENCAYEIQIEPDFEPEFEPVIDTNIDVNDQVNTISDDAYQDTLDELPLLEQIRHLRNRAIIIGTIVVVSIIAIGFMVYGILRMNSLDYQLNNVKKKAAAGKYESAISELENLYVLYPNESQIFYLEAEYYIQLGKTDIAIDTLMRVLTVQGIEAEDKYTAYDRLISIYDADSDYESICLLLDECEYPEIVNNYQNYLAMSPVFSYESGEYDTQLRLKLSSNTSGDIYYTLDGSVPNDTSIKYDAPIWLEHGEYVVSAIFINQYGIVSDMVSNTYIISSDIPDDPVVNHDSGAYSKPCMIMVDVPEGCSVYYTTDKSIPTIDSVQYIDPIPMPIGYSNFSFICINEQDMCSDVVVKSYHLGFPDGIKTSQAIENLKTRLVERGLLNDMSGTSDRAPGRYTYEVISAVSISGQGDYYTIREFLHDGSGNVTPTDTTYIVEIYQGSTAILGGDAVSGFLAIAF